MDAVTWHDQRPSHKPTTRQQEIMAAGVNFDRVRCFVVDAEPELAIEMQCVSRWLSAYIRQICKHEYIPQADGQGDDVEITHVCPKCGSILEAQDGYHNQD